jgi:hypothetical protein
MIATPLHTADAQSVGDILVDRLGERIRLLEDHADTHPDLDRIHLRMQQVRVVRMKADVALVPIARIQVVHAIEAPQVRRLTASGRTDQCRHLASHSTGMLMPLRA